MSETVEKNITQTVIRKSNTNDEAPASLESSAPTSETSKSRTISLPPAGEPLGQQLALELLCQGIRLAQSRGAYKLEESSVFLRAINEFLVSRS